MMQTLLTPTEVAEMFRVDPKTVTRWAKAGRLTTLRTLGGHRRYVKSEVEAILATSTRFKEPAVVTDPAGEPG